MNRKLLAAIILSTALILTGTITVVANGDPAPELTPLEELGKMLFFDTDLSVNGKMSCATCHAPEAGFTGPDSEINDATAV